MRYVVIAAAILAAVASAHAAPRSFFGQGLESAAPWSGPRGAVVPPFASEREAVVMAADTLTVVPIRTDSRVLVFSFDCNVWVKLGQSDTTFSLPSATTADGTGPTFKPAARMIPADSPAPTHIILRSATACVGSIEFYGGSS